MIAVKYFVKTFPIKTDHDLLFDLNKVLPVPKHSLRKVE